jgi:hypothetical protein
MFNKSFSEREALFYGASEPVAKKEIINFSKLSELKENDKFMFQSGNNINTFLGFKNTLFSLIYVYRVEDGKPIETEIDLEVLKLPF